MTNTNDIAKLVERLRNNRIEYLTAVGDHQHEPCELCLEAADALSRIAEERDEALDALEAERMYNAQLFDEITATELLADVRKVNLEAAERERDELKAEVKRLREIISQCAAALPNSAFIVGQNASLEFMGHLPKEIALVCAGLRTEESP